MTKNIEYKLEVFGEYFKITEFKIETIIKIYSIKEIAYIKEENNGNIFGVRIYFRNGDQFGFDYRKKEARQRRDKMFGLLDQMISNYYRSLINKRKEIF